MDGVKLMDRTDTKFTFNINELPDSFRMKQKITIVYWNVEGNRISRYKTLYFDTQNFALYNQHHCGKLNRYKIRHRTYVESNIRFFRS
jgi:hypothetical protein